MYTLFLVIELKVLWIILKIDLVVENLACVEMFYEAVSATIIALAALH